MINITMLVHNRPKLTLQSIESLYANTPLDKFNLTVIDDESYSETKDVLELKLWSKNATLLTVRNSKKCTGMVRNLSVYWAEKYWGRGRLLYLSDNDVYFQPGWLQKMDAAFSYVKHKGVKVLGPYRHPYHQPNETINVGPIRVNVLDAVIGLGHLMEWNTWDTYGPLDAHAPGTNQSEDFAFCQKIIKDGYKVATMDPHVVLNCGVVGSYGTPAVGHEILERYPNLVMEG